MPGGPVWIGPDGRRRGIKRGNRNLTRAELAELGYTMRPPTDKLRFVA